MTMISDPLNKQGFKVDYFINSQSLCFMVRKYIFLAKPLLKLNIVVISIHLPKYLTENAYHQQRHKL